tara:strand:- start:2357 stop:2554 length:198 start_codon:yes stop_codon:yes gene_type:complete
MEKMRSLVKDDVTKLLDYLLNNTAEDGGVYSEVRDKLVSMILDRPVRTTAFDDDFSARKERWIAP